MSDVGPPPQSDSNRLTYALLGGLAALPFVALSYWQTGSEVSFGAVVFGGLLAGYLLERAGGDARGVGARAGLVGGLPLLWALADVLAATSALAGPAWFVAGATATTVVFVLGVAVLGFGLAALVGEVGGRIGGWLAGQRADGSPLAA
jgi:hypothetical protein